MKMELNFSKSDEATYRALVADLTEQGRRAIEARAEADRLTRLSDLTKKMLTYSASCRCTIGEVSTD